VGTFNFSAKYLSKKDSSTMLPELTEFVPATRMNVNKQLKKGSTRVFFLFRQNNRRSIYNTIGNNTADI
jgi:hypothetical protein